MDKIKFKENHFKMIGDGLGVEITYDEKPLLSQDGWHWSYITEENGQLVYNRLKKFDDKFFHIFLDDIIEQLMNGINRNNLTMNIPHEVKRVKIGNKIIEI